MVAQDQVTAWDLKPNRENTNQIFNVLCNVQPVEHPWSGEWYLRQTDVTEWSKQQYWFEKCKGLKKCKTYKYSCKDWEPELKELIWNLNEDGWENANFTDVIQFWWYRIYMRKNNEVIVPYWDQERHYVVRDSEVIYDEPIQSWEEKVVYVMWTWDGNEDTCDIKKNPNDQYHPSERIKHYRPIDNTVTNVLSYDNDQMDEDYSTSSLIRIYIQQIDSRVCSWDSFDDADESPIILVKEYLAAECNPDHFIMWYWGIWVPNAIKWKDWWNIKIAIIYYWWQYFAY